MSSSNSWSTTIISIIFGLLLLLIVYLWFEAREEDSEGNKNFSPQKLGIILRNLFGYCCPDGLLIFFASLCICCGYVGNSCLDQINADEERRETKRMARLAANLTKKSKQKKKRVNQKSLRTEHDFAALSSSEDEIDDLESGHGGGGSSGSVSSSGSNSRRKERNRTLKLQQKSPLRETSTRGIDHTQSDRSLRGTGMVSSSLQDTNISQQLQQQHHHHQQIPLHIASPMGLVCQEDEGEVDDAMEEEEEDDSDLSSNHSSSSPTLSTHSESTPEEVVIELSSHLSPLLDFPPPSTTSFSSLPPPPLPPPPRHLSSSRRKIDKQKNALLANHFISKDFLERHIAIEDQLLAEQTSFSLLSLTDLTAAPPPRSNTHSY
jgi:hypothetical protein